MNRRRTLAWLAALPIAARADQLTTPALPSVRAAQSLMLALAFAGSRLVAAGERGRIVLSDDLGRTWQQAAVPVSVTLTALSFPSAQVGYATGHDGVVLKTTDGGRVWSKVFDGAQANQRMRDAAQLRVDKARAANNGTALKDAELALDDAQAALSAGPARPLLGVWFADDRNGWVVGSYGMLFRTADGGATWTMPEALPPNAENLHYNHIGAPAPGALLIAGEGGRVYRSGDDGKRWEALDTGYKGQLYGAMQLGDALVAFGFGGHVFRKDAGAKDWMRVPTTTRKSLVGGTPLADGRIVLVSQDGGLELSSDGARSFKYVGGPPLPLAALVATPDRSKVIVAGFGGVRLFPLSAGAA